MNETDAIFLLQPGGQLVKVPYTRYVSEDMLQKLIADHPDLLVGEQIDGEDPPRWLLVTREAGIPDDEDSNDRWSLDHLLLDERGTPTLVEVKRSTDTRIRREMVGQMLDYAANATRYWPTDRIRSLAAQQAGGVEELDVRIRELIGGDADDGATESFWQQVEENLRAGHVRLLFVADELPRELRRIIEFLNEHMQKIEVLGVEVRHYQGSGMQALVPRVIGQTERARDLKDPSGALRKTDSAAFLQACPGATRQLFDELLQSVQDEGLIVNWGTRGFSIRGDHPDGSPARILYGYPAGSAGSASPYLEVYFKEVATDDGVDRLRKLMTTLGFVGRGQWTLRLFLSDDTRVRQARAALPHVWAFYRRVRGMDADSGSFTVQSSLPGGAALPPGPEQLQTRPTAVGAAGRSRAHQRDWADRRAKEVDDDGYTLLMDDNLFQPLNADTRTELGAGAGGELGGSDTRGKIQALHASSALAVNVFDYWRNRPRQPLQRALGLQVPIRDIQFERTFPTGMQGTPPHLDVALLLEDNSLIAIESKFLEPYPAKGTPRSFRDTYFPDVGRWAQKALPACQELAESIRSGARAYEYLDAQQLLKHALGLANTTQGRSALWYFWYDPGGEEGAAHAREIEEFSGCIDPIVGFLARRYHDVLKALAVECGTDHSEYLDYVLSRYGASAAEKA